MEEYRFGAGFRARRDLIDVAEFRRAWESVRVRAAEATRAESS